MVDKNTGNVIIVAAPSGGGKTSLVNNLISNLANIEVSISHTTRNIRPRECDEKDYFFISQEQFLDMINDNAFVEYAQVFNHYYGTSCAQINSRLAAGIDVVLDIDWQGAQQIKDLFPDAVTVFIIPPSLQILKERLHLRGQDDHQAISARMRQAQDELSHFAEFDYLIVNENFEKAAEELRAVVIANRLRVGCQSEKLVNLLSFLLASQ